MRQLLFMFYLIGVVILAGCEWTDAAVVRSNTVRHAFAKANPCPSTGQAVLPCPGYVIDHIVPLCAGGADDVKNMQWQTVANGKLKDAFEKRACRCFTTSISKW